MENNIPTAEELKKGYKDYYILLSSSLLGDKFDIIKCVNTRESWTTIIKANGTEHSFAASIDWGLEQKWFIPFSHTAYTKLHVEAALEAATKVLDVNKDGDYLQYPTTERILNSYPLINIK